MAPARAIVSETSRLFDLDGRTARADYLWFLLFWTLFLGVMIVVCIKVLPTDQANVGIYLTTAVLYLPVTSAGVRRLHDAGESGALMLDPLKPAIAVGCILLILYFLGTSTQTGSIIAFLTAFFFGKLAVAIAVIVALVAIAITLIFFSNTMGLLLLPSQPGPNKYGPNPNEVPS